MGYVGFVVAMAAEIGTADPCQSRQRRRTSSEWLIVSRWGREGEFLTVSRTGIGRDAGSVAPIGLAPSVTCIGVLMAPPADLLESLPGDMASDLASDMPPGQRPNIPSDTFSLTRRLPFGVTVAGTFAPADGFIRLRGPVETMQLTASARNAEDPTTGGDLSGNSGLKSRTACPGTLANWNIRAFRRPWDGEFIEQPDLLTC